jgi:hypothetical protein
MPVNGEQPLRTFQRPFRETMSDDDDDDGRDLFASVHQSRLVVLVLVLRQNNNNTDGGFANFDVVPTAVARSATILVALPNLMRYQQRRL